MKSTHTRNEVEVIADSTINDTSSFVHLNTNDLPEITIGMQRVIRQSNDEGNDERHFINTKITASVTEWMAIVDAVRTLITAEFLLVANSVHIMTLNEFNEQQAKYEAWQDNYLESQREAELEARNA